MMIKHEKRGHLAKSAIMLLLLALFGCNGKTPAKLNAITVTPECFIITSGGEKKFVATGRYSDNTEKDITAQVTWSSSDTSVASISSVGLATAAAPLKAGKTDITAVLEGITGRSALAVTDMELPQSISVTPADTSIPYGTSIQFKAEGTLSDGSKQDLTSLINWVSSNSTVKFLCDAPGRAKSTVKGGALAEVTASLGNIEGKTGLTIKNVDLTFLRIEPSPYAWMVSGFHLQIKSTGSFSDSTIWDITNDVDWTSSDQTVAVIDSNGLATSTYGNQGRTAISAISTPPMTAMRAETTLDVSTISE